MQAPLLPAAARSSPWRVLLLRVLIAGSESGTGWAPTPPAVAPSSGALRAAPGLGRARRAHDLTRSLPALALRGGAGKDRPRSPARGSRGLSSPQDGGGADAGRAAAPLLSLGPGLVRATVVRRPSERNKSPFVGDVRLSDGRVALAHMPSMSMGGKCAPGSQVMMKTARRASGEPVGSNATGKFGTPKCEFVLQLLLVEEPENAHLSGCWVAAHPSLGEQVASQLLSRGSLDEALGAAVVAVESEVNKPAGSNMRCDFVVSHGARGHASRTVLEVKTVVDSDYNPATAPARRDACFLGRTSPYARAAIFPWGTKRQIGPDGEKVVSARAIKHVDELAALARGELKDDDGTRLGAAILFAVVRGDCLSFRPNDEACPSFARHLRAARDAGVRIVARRISWNDDGCAFDEGAIPADLS